MRDMNIYSPLYSSYENINIYKRIKKISDHSETSTDNISCDTKGKILVKDAENEKIGPINKNMTKNLEKNEKNQILYIPPRGNNIKDLVFFQNTNHENYPLNGYNMPPNKIINSINPISYAYLMSNKNGFYNKQNSIQNNNTENYVNNLNNKLKNQINNMHNDDKNYTERYVLSGNNNATKPNISKIVDKNKINNYIPRNAHNLNTKNNMLYNHGNYIYNNYNEEILNQYNQGSNIYRSMSCDNVNNTTNRYSHSFDNNKLTFLGPFVPLIPNNNIKANTKMRHGNNMINLSFIPKNNVQRRSSSYLLTPLNKDKQNYINMNRKALNPNDQLKKNNNKKYSFNFSDYFSFCENPMRSASIDQSVGSSFSYVRRKGGKGPSTTNRDRKNTLTKIYNFLFPYNQKESLEKKNTIKNYNPKNNSINYTQLKHSNKNESFCIINSNSKGGIQHLYHTNNRKNKENNSNIFNENYAHNSFINRNGTVSPFNNIQNETTNNAYNYYYKYYSPEQMKNPSFLYNTHHNNNNMAFGKQYLSKNGKNQNMIKSSNDANLTFSNVHQHINSIPKTNNNPKGPNMENTILNNNYKNTNISYLPSQYNNANTNSDAKTYLQNIDKIDCDKNYNNTKDGISGSTKIYGKNTLQHKDSLLLNYQNVTQQSQINTNNVKGNMMRSISAFETPTNKLKAYNIDKFLYSKSNTYNVDNDKKEYIPFEQEINPNSINQDSAVPNNKNISLNPLEKLTSKCRVENKNNTIHEVNNLFNKPNVLDTADNGEKNKNTEITLNPNLAETNLNENYIDLINNNLLNMKKNINGSHEFDTRESELNINEINFKATIMNSHDHDLEKLKTKHNIINSGNNASAIDGINEILLSMSKSHKEFNAPLNALNEESQNNDLYEKSKHTKLNKLIKKKQELKANILETRSSIYNVKKQQHQNLHSIPKSQESIYFKMKALTEVEKKALGDDYNDATVYKKFDPCKNKIETIAKIHRNDTNDNDFVPKKLVTSNESFRSFFSKHMNNIEDLNSSDKIFIEKFERLKNDNKDTNNLCNLKSNIVNTTKNKVTKYKMNASSELTTTGSESHYLGKKKALIITLSYNGLLEGCKNDTAQICKHLVESFNFNELTLLNDSNFCYKNYVAQKATRKNIINHLRDFIINSNNGDILFFYYCGYSTKIIDSKFSEDNNFALLPQDYSNNKYIYSNEICHIIKKLKGGKQLCIIFDTTYSSYFVPTPISITYNKSINATELPKNEHLPFSYKKNAYSFKMFGKIKDRHTDPIYIENVKKPENNKFPEKKHIKDENQALVPSIFFFSPDFRDRNEYELLINGKFRGLLTYCIGKSIKLLKSNFSYHDLFLLSSQMLLNIKKKYKIKYINFRLSFLNEYSPDDIKFLSHESLYLYKKRQIEEPLWKTSIRLGSINESIKSKFSSKASELSLNISKMCLLIFIKDIQFFSKTKIDTSIEYFVSCFIKPKNVNILCVRRKNTKTQKVVRDKIFFLEYIVLGLGNIKNAKFYVELFKKKKKNYFVARSVFNIKNTDGRYSLVDEKENIIGIIDLNVKHIIEN